MAATTYDFRLFRTNAVGGQTVAFQIQDSSVTTGAGKTGIAYNAAGLKAYSSVDGSAPAAITLANVAGDGFWQELDSTNAPGLYALTIPAALMNSSGKVLSIYISGATGASPCHIYINLISINEQAGRLPY